MNMQHTATTTILLCFVLFAIGCSSSPKQTSQTLDKQSQNAAIPLSTASRSDSTLFLLGKNINTLRLKGTVSLQGTQNLSGLPFEAVIAAQDSFQITMGGPFGITAARMYANKMSFVLINYITRQVFDGNVYSKELASQLPFPIDMPAMMSLMSGKIPGNVHEFMRVRQLQDGSAYLYERKTPFGVEYAAVDTAKMVLKQYQRKDGNGTTLVNITMGNVTDVDGIPIPFSVDITVDNKKEEARFRFTDAEVNMQIQKPLVVTIPDGLTRTTYR